MQCPKVKFNDRSKCSHVLKQQAETTANRKPLSILAKQGLSKKQQLHRYLLES